MVHTTTNSNRKKKTSSQSYRSPALKEIPDAFKLLRKENFYSSIIVLNKREKEIPEMFNSKAT